MEKEIYTDRNEKIEFTPEGMEKLIDSLTFLPEEYRRVMLYAVLATACM